MARYDPKLVMAKCVLLESKIFSYDWNTQWANEYIFLHLGFKMEFCFLALLIERLFFFFFCKNKVCLDMEIHAGNSSFSRITLFK